MLGPHTRVLEPSPPAVSEPPWFADDPTDALPLDYSAREGDLAWRERHWLGPYARLAALPPPFTATRDELHRLAVGVLSPARAAQNGKIGLRWTFGGFGTPFFGPDGTNFENLVHPQTPGDEKLVQTLTNKFKIDPVFAEKVNEEYGPLDWRLAETHAIYWGALGLQKAKEHPGKVKASDLITLRRLIYQSMLQAFHHGRIISNPFNQSVELAPNLGLIPRLNDTYLKMYADETDPGQKNGILTAHRNFLSDAVYFLYENDRVADAAKW